MPNITEYTNPIDGLQPSDRGTDAAAQAGRRVGSFYHQIGESVGSTISDVGDAYVKHQEQVETLELMKTGTDKRLALRQQYDDYMRDPKNANDPAASKRFMDEVVTPGWEDWAANAKTDAGKRIAAEWASEGRQTMFEHTSAIQSSVDSEHAIQNGKDTIHGMASEIANDPGGNHDKQIGAMVDAAQAMAGNIANPAERERVSGELTALARNEGATSHYLGLINSGQAGIDQARKDLATGVYEQYLTTAEREHLGNVADEQERTNASKLKAADLAATQAAEREGRGVYANIIAGMQNPDGTPRPASPDDVQAAKDFARKYGQYLPAEAKSLVDSIQTTIRDGIEKKYVQDDPATMANANTMVAAGTMTHAYADKLHAQGLLSEKSWHDLHESIERNANDPTQKYLTQQTEQLFQKTKSQFGATNMVGNFQKGEVADKYYQWQAFVQNTIATARQNKMSPEQIRTTYLDPASKDFVGAAHWINYYTHVDPQGVNSYVAHAAVQARRGSGSGAVAPGEANAVAHGRAAAAAAGPAQAGESPEAYLARIGH